MSRTVRRPLGCLTFSALVAVIVIGAGVAVAAATTGNGIFSPGGLSGVANAGPLGGVASHAELGGRCDACHPAFWSTDRMADRCLGCHTNVRQELASASGLHGRFDTGSACRACHTDHHGPTADLTRTDASVFPHERTGYVLVAHPTAGRGVRFGCRDCHPGAPQAYVPPACVNCHQSRDAAFMSSHQATFGSACLNCHDGVDTYGASFTHSTYPLLGAHAVADCGTCHSGATTISTLRGTATDCVTCHATKDIHAGRLGTSCGDCHTPATWTGATIDHDRTRYPLIGIHVTTRCEACHVADQWTGIGLTCVSCHAKDNPHGGQFPGDCVSCHSPTGWSDVTFSHDQTGFALVGTHATTACAACHVNGVFKGTPTTCYACHAANDQHKGAFGRSCGACHKTTTWADVTFNHDASSFPLTGAHRTVSCTRCHVGGVFTGTPTACKACHTAPSSHAVGFGSSCGSCHKTSAWTPAVFNAPHQFPLNHGGAGGVCTTCHKTSYTTYTCAACHSATAMASQHAGVANYSTNCIACHPTGGGGG